MDDLLTYVRNVVHRFAGDDPRLKNDLDDLVQDVFVRILPKLEDRTEKEQRNFAYLAAYSVCMNAKIPKKTKISPIPVGNLVYTYGRNSLDDVDINDFCEKNEALIEWIDKEDDPGVLKELRKQLDELIREL